MSSNGRRVLIVEDEGATILLLLRVLTASGFTVAGTAVNGAEAIEVARHAEPDFILMDTNMPVMDGIEATRRIMAERPVPIIMLTGYSPEDNLDAALEAGACGYVTKPVTGATLVLAIEEALAACADGEDEAFEKGEV